MNLQECLPAELRGDATTIARISAGVSGAGVYRVEADGRAFVLKIAADGDPVARWPNRRAVLQLAADAGLAPRIVHVDDERRAVVSELVVDRSFPAFYGDPRTRAEAVALLGRTLRRGPQLSPPPRPPPPPPRAFPPPNSSPLLGGPRIRRFPPARRRPIRANSSRRSRRRCWPAPACRRSSPTRFGACSPRGRPTRGGRRSSATTTSTRRTSRSTAPSYGCSTGTAP